MLSPYSLVYASRLSILLVAWTVLPWMVALVVRALRDDGWKYPAVFAILVQLAGSVNATALLLAGIGPLLWIPYAVCVSREVSLRRALRTTDAHRRAQRPHLAVVDRRAEPAGRVRPQRAQVHGDDQGRRDGGSLGGGPPRARLLVLLRRRQARALDRGHDRLHGAALADPGELRDPGHRDAVGRVHPLATPRVLHRARPRGCHHRGGGTPLQRPVTVRRDREGVRPGIDRRTGVAERRSRRSAARARSRGAARVGRQPAHPVAASARAAPARTGRGRPGRRGAHRQLAGAVGWDVLRQEPAASRDVAEVLDAGHLSAQQGVGQHEDPRAARR